MFSVMSTWTVALTANEKPAKASGGGGGGGGSPVISASDIAMELAFGMVTLALVTFATFLIETASANADTPFLGLKAVAFVDMLAVKVIVAARRAAEEDTEQPSLNVTLGPEVTVRPNAVPYPWSDRG